MGNSIYTCPVCGDSLLLKEKTYRCKNNHCFDLAKEGYINLLPLKSKKTKDPGDNSKMMIARREFLETQYYKPLALYLSEKIEYLSNKNVQNILDIGCGEGYYAGIISDHLHSESQLYGLDISKVAVKYASKRYKNISFCVGSSYEIPIMDNTIDLVYRIYAPSLETELNRVVKKGGYLITVTPGNNHLYQLREIIYKEVLNLSTKDDESESFKSISSYNLTYTMNIMDNKIIQDLLDMTPFGWKISPDAHKKLMNKEAWNIDCDFKIDIFEKVK